MKSLQLLQRIRRLRGAFRSRHNTSQEQYLLLRCTRKLPSGLRQRFVFLSVLRLQTFILSFSIMSLKVPVIGVPVIISSGRLPCLSTVLIVLFPLWIWLVCPTDVPNVSRTFYKTFPILLLITLGSHQFFPGCNLTTTLSLTLRLRMPAFVCTNALS